MSSFIVVSISTSISSLKSRHKSITISLGSRSSPLISIQTGAVFSKSLKVMKHKGFRIVKYCSHSGMSSSSLISSIMLSHNFFVEIGQVINAFLINNSKALINIFSLVLTFLIGNDVRVFIRLSA